MQCARDVEGQLRQLCILVGSALCQKKFGALLSNMGDSGDDWLTRFFNHCSGSQRIVAFCALWAL